jgi:glycosyltransferase involved in cell wall biosynthesis
MNGKKLRVLMIGGSHKYPDSRLRYEAEALCAEGYGVTVVVSRRPGERTFETVRGVRVIRMPIVSVSLKADGRRGLLRTLRRCAGHLLEHGFLTVASFLIALAVMVVEGIDIIHAHNPPDTFCCWAAAFKVLGKRVVFDHHDLAPELYLSRFGERRRGDLIHRLLLLTERISCRVADVVIATNESYRELEIERGGARPESVFVVRNGPDLERVRPRPQDPALLGMRRHLLGYIGAMNPQDGVDYLLRALWHLAYELGRRDFFCILIGPGDSVADLKAMASQLGLDDHVHFTGFIPDEIVFRYLSTVDICVDPDPSSPLNDRSTWIKVMEFMALGKPIVCFDLKETRVSAQGAALYVPPNDVREFARAIIQLCDDPELRERMGRIGRQRVESELEWRHSRANLLRAYEHLQAGHLGRVQPRPAA